MYYIGIDVGGTNLVSGLVNEKGRILDKVSHPVDKAMTAEELCVELARLAKKVCEMGALDYSQIEAVGVGLPGVVDNGTGMVVQTPNMAFSNTPFRALFQKEWNVPVFLANDANCAAVGEYWAGAAKGCDPAVVVTLGTGIGGGLVVGGKLFTGFANSGKDSVMWELCEGDRFKVQGRTAFQGARLGDPAAKRVLNTYLHGLSIGIINLINILQPEIICLGGGISNAEDDLLLDPLRQLVDEGTFDKSNPTRLEKASLGNDAGVVGAALLCHMM